MKLLVPLASTVLIIACHDETNGRRIHAVLEPSQKHEQVPAQPPLASLTEEPSSNQGSEAIDESPVPRVASAAPHPTFVLLDEKVVDSPIKTQIEQHIVVSPLPTSSQLKAEILDRYRKAKARRGFQHHNPATNVYIYVYGTEEQARAGRGLWIGMLAMGPQDRADPIVQIDDARLQALKQPPSERLGLSEEIRRNVYRAILDAEKRAMRDAKAKVPSTQVMKLIEVEDELARQYKAEVVARYGLTKDQLLKITVEGIQKGWPY